MATLERIRSKAGIAVAVIIGLALLGFILQDLLDSRKSIFRGTKNNVGKIAGESIPLQRFQQTEAELSQNIKLLYNIPTLDEKMQDQVREQTWQQIINEEVVDKEFKKLGLTVSSDELTDMFLGANPNPMIRQMFTNRETGEFNRASVSQFLKMTGDDAQITSEEVAKNRQIRLYLEKELMNQRMNMKYFNLIAKGLGAPKFLAKNEAEESDKKVDVSYVMQRYSSVADASVKIENSDLEKYYKEHKYLYEQVAGRDLEYVSFDILPSAADRESVEREINKIKPEFVAATEVEDFVRPYAPYVDKNYKQADLPDSLGKFMFSAKVGEVYGPYFENGSYKLARLYKTVEMPDSVKARHILLAIKTQDPAEADKLKKTADSLMNVIEKGGDFEALAKKYSDDKSNSEKGGDLGWFKEGTMVKPFNDAAFETKKKETKVVLSQFGYHILQVLDRSKDTKKVKVAFIEIKLDPSKTTFDKVYSDAMRFASENRTYQQFNAAISKQNLLKKPAYNVTENAKSIEGLDQARQVVKWAYTAKPGDISEPFSIGTDKYVVAALVNVREKGTAPLEQVKSQVELEVRKQKKAEKIIADINKIKGSAASIQDLALKLNIPVENATAINFSTFSLPTGAEPKIIALATSYAKNKLSDAYDGNSGVYVFYVTNIVEPAPSKDFTEYKLRLNAGFVNKAYESTQALIKAAKIEDNRSLFF